MKRLTLIPLALALGAGLTACGGSFDEKAATAAANEKCKEDVLQHAKNPASVEFVDGPQGGILDYARYAPDDYEGNIHMLALTNNGKAHFPNAFGVMTEMTFGCVGYFNEAGELAGSDYEVHEGSDEAMYSFGYPGGLKSTTLHERVDSMLELRNQQ